jgi:hypothetical protein
MPPRVPAPRLAMIQARQAPVAVVFRRGPSKWVECIRWNLSNDTIERGHWFHGRIYERRSDLSPDGSKLIYFASKFTGRTLKDREYTYAWTAISRPPWLTALALWPKGDCWHGGGLFRDDRTVWLNHKPEQAVPHPDHRPRFLRVLDNPDARGEDEPVYGQRLTRDGWAIVEPWDWEFTGIGGGFRTNQPEVRHREQPGGSGRVVMRRYLQRYRYIERFSLEDVEAPSDLPLGSAQWVDWDRAGRLLLLDEGRLLVAAVDQGKIARPTVVADLTDDRPEERGPPLDARVW